MATWTSIANAAVAAGAAATTSLFTALRDNVTALAEGASGAPRIQFAAIELLNPETAIVSALTADTTILSAVDFSAVGVARYEFTFGDTSGNTSGATVEIRMSDDGGSTWSGWNAISGGIERVEWTSGHGYINMIDGTVKGASGNTGGTVSQYDLTITAAADTFEMRLNFGNTTVSGALFVMPITGRTAA